MVIKQKSLSLLRNLALETFVKLSMVFSAKSDKSDIQYSDKSDIQYGLFFLIWESKIDSYKHF